MGKLEGKVALITGGASGIGAAAARQFVAEGAKVLITDLDEGAGKAFAGDVGPNCLFQRGDHCVRRDNEAAVAAVLDQWGRLDILYNNAGVEHRGAVEAVDDEALSRLLDVNISGPVRMTQAALPVLREAAASGGASILFTASIQAIMVRPEMTIYGAAKHGIAGFLSSLALELAPKKIRVNGICPGPVVTPMLKRAAASVADGAGMSQEVALDGVRASIPMQSLIDPLDIARAAVFLCSDDAAMITGVLLPVDGGITAR